MSVKNDAIFWITPSGYRDPQLVNCGNVEAFGKYWGQLPEATNWANGYDPTPSGRQHFHAQTQSPQVTENRQGVLSKVGGGVNCNDNRRAIIDFSNHDDNSCPSISMVGQFQQLLQSTEDLTNTGVWRYRDVLLQSENNDVDPFQTTNVYRLYGAAGTSGSTNQLNGSIWQQIAYNRASGALYLNTQGATTSIFVKRGTQGTRVGLIAKYAFTSNNANDYFAVFDFDTEQIQAGWPTTFQNNISPDYNKQLEFKVEKYPNGWYRLVVSHWQTGNFWRYFACYTLKDSVTPQSWYNSWQNNDFQSYICDDNQYFLISKPNYGVNGIVVVNDTLPVSGSYASSAGRPPYVENTSTTASVTKLQTGIRQILPNAATDNYSFFWDIYVTNDVPRHHGRQAIQEFYSSFSPKQYNPFFYFTQPEYYAGRTDHVKGECRVRLKLPTTGNPLGQDIAIPQGRNKLFFQNNEVWINGVKYDSEEDWQVGAVDYFGYKQYQIKAQARYFIKNAGFWNRQLTEAEIQTLM